MTTPAPHPRRIFLTPRQKDVVRLIGRGLDTREIADELAITIDAVQFHVNAIADKLDNPGLLTPLRLIRRWVAQRAADETTGPGDPDGRTS